MAHLRGPRDRGQVILIAAVALAVTFVTLALVVNSAIFTENLASRGETSGGDTALAERYTAEQRAGDVVAAANRNNFSSESALKDAVEAGVNNSSQQAEKHTVLSGALSNTSDPHDYEFGSRIVMNGSTEFTDDGTATGAADWQLVERVDNDYASQPETTREFELTVEKSGLIDTGVATLTPFRIVVNNTGSPNKQWEVEIWQDATSDDVFVETERPDPAGGTVSQKCTISVPDSEFSVSLTDGTVDSRACSALRYDHEDDVDFRFGGGIGTPYNITFENGDEISGNYSFVTTEPESDVESLGNVGASPTTGSPYVTKAIYEVDVTYMYVNTNVNYTTTIRVARGEADG